MDNSFIFTGSVWRFGDDIDTDAIINAKYLNLTRIEDLKVHCMGDIDHDFHKKVNVGDILVAGENFGCGSSREHAPLSIKGCGISCVVAVSFSRLFYRNAINIGLPVIALEEAGEITEGSRLKVDCMAGIINDLTSGREYRFAPWPEFMSELLTSGGLVPYMENRLDAR